MLARDDRRRRPRPWQPKPRSGCKPWEVDLTLCIAAISQRLEEGAAIVFSFDHRVERGGEFGAQIGFKATRLSPLWSALFAGTVSSCKELAWAYGQHFKDNPDSNDPMEWLRVPVNQFRRSRANMLTQAKLSVSYEEFLKQGKEWFPEAVRQDTVSLVESQYSTDMDAHLILMGWYRGYFMLVTVCNGVLEVCDDFACIGTGSTIAQGALHQREQSNRQDNIPEAPKI